MLYRNGDKLRATTSKRHFGNCAPLFHQSRASARCVRDLGVGFGFALLLTTQLALGPGLPLCGNRDDGVK